MVIQILFSYFSLANLVALAQKIRNLLVAKFPEQPLVITLQTSLDTAIATALQAIGSTTRQSTTILVRSADKVRDDSYQSLRHHIEAGLKRQNEVYRAACEALVPDFEKNDILLYRMPDGEETAAIDSLIRDLSTTEKQAHLETIHATEWLAELDRDNKAFVSKSMQRSETRSANDTLADEKAFLQLQTALKLACSIIDSLQLTDGLTEAPAVMDEANQHIAEANASAKLSQRRPRR